MDPRAAYAMKAYERCELCPRMCRVNRTCGEKGFCGESDVLRIAAIEAHFGEEPPISGLRGSGTVFFSGCSLKCHYCQNYQISRDGLGQQWRDEDVVRRIARLYYKEGIHNVNMVTPDHFFPHVASIVQALRREGILIPVVFNTSGYQRAETLRSMEPFVDIYLPDFKYSDGTLAKDLSSCPDYPSVALEAIAEMVRQKDFLHCDHLHRPPTEVAGAEAEAYSVATRGVLVRHLILPGHVQNSCDALTMLFLEFGADLPLSIMSQYVPVSRSEKYRSLDRAVQALEFRKVLKHAKALGFRKVFVQVPDQSGERPFLPDFRSANPFLGNIRRPIAGGDRAG